MCLYKHFARLFTLSLNKIMCVRTCVFYNVVLCIKSNHKQMVKIYIVVYDIQILLSQ